MGDNKTTGSEPLSDEALEDVSGGNWFTDIFTATPKPNPREGEIIGETKTILGQNRKFQIQN